MIRGIFKRNQRSRLEKELNSTLRLICRICGVPLNEWYVNKKLHINETLYSALKESKDLRSAKNYLVKYNRIILKAEKLNIKIDSNYYWLYNLNS